MRPLELTLRNFRSYFGDDIAFDFRGRGLVGVVGPIGSGKSSLLDAISFALYGKTSAGGANTKALIHQRAGDGAVKLRFEVEGEVWEVVRSLRRKGASQHALYRYEDDIAGTEAAERITLEGDVNEKIAELLGLDFDAFGRSVLLAQGRFAEFLRSRPAERDAVLKGVFGHDRIDAMREIAKTRAGGVSSELGLIRARTEQIERVAARLAETKAALDESELRLETMRKLEPRLADIDARLLAAQTERGAAETRIASLERHAVRLPDDAAVADLVWHAGAMAEERAKLAGELEGAQAEVQEADAAVAAAEEGGAAVRLEEAARLLAVGDPQRRAVHEAQRRAEAAEARLADLETRLESSVARAERAKTRLAEVAEVAADAAAAVALAEAELHAAEHADMAAALRGTLVPGDPCPVCAQEVSAVPPETDQSDVEAVRDALAAAREERAAAEKQRREAEAAHASRRADRESLVSSVADAERALAAARGDVDEAISLADVTTGRLVELLGEGEPSELLAAARKAQDELRQRAAGARRRLEQVRGRHDSAIRDEQDTAKRLATLRVEIADLAARLGVPIVVGSDDAADVGRAASTLRRAWDEELATLQRSRNAADAVIAEAQESRRKLLDDAEIVGEFAAAVGAAEATVKHLTDQVAADRRELEAADRLLAEQQRLEAELGVYERLAADLTNARFVRFLLDDERARLSHLGSEHFLRLSSGRYEFTDDGTFSIVDLTAADAVRKSASLSGGETFLASLALALSLAEMVTRTGGRLDAFFLDEGFGSLDPEHLDLAMEGIEALVADDSSRLVVVVSHVPELRERIEDLIRLDRDPLTGDTRVLQA